MYLLVIGRKDSGVKVMESIRDALRDALRDAFKENAPKLRAGLVYELNAARQGILDANPDIIIVDALTPHSLNILRGIRLLTKAIVIVVGCNTEDTMEWKMAGADRCLQEFDGARLLKAYNDSAREKKAGSAAEKFA